MGVIISGVRMISEPYNYILQKSWDIHVYELKSNLVRFLNDSFGALKPLSHKYKTVCDINEEPGRSTHYLCVGSWLRTRWGSRGHGSHVNDIIPYVLKYGDELKEHVRRPIKDDFAKAVDLTKELKEYEDIGEAITVSPRKLHSYWMYRSLEVNEKTVNGLTLNTSMPKIVILKSDGDDSWRIDISNDNSPAVIEDIIDDVVRLYDMVDAKLSVVREHNQRITSQIDQVIMPYKLLNAFK